MFIFKRLLIFDINIYNNFEYVHVKFERKNYFYNKIMIIRKTTKTLLSKYDKKKLMRD